MAKEKRSPFIQKGDMYIGNANRRVRVGQVFTDEGVKKVPVYDMTGGRDVIDFDEFVEEFEKE